METSEATNAHLAEESACHSGKGLPQSKAGSRQELGRTGTGDSKAASHLHAFRLTRTLPLEQHVGL